MYLLYFFSKMNFISISSIFVSILLYIFYSILWRKYFFFHDFEKSQPSYEQEVGVYTLLFLHDYEGRVNALNPIDCITCNISGQQLSKYNGKVMRTQSQLLLKVLIMIFIVNGRRIQQVTRFQVIEVMFFKKSAD